MCKCVGVSVCAWERVFMSVKAPIALIKALWHSAVNTHTHSFSDLTDTSNSLLPTFRSNNLGVCACSIVCTQAKWSIYTRIQRPAEGVLHHTAPLPYILTLRRQVLLQKTIELLQSWQPAHCKERERRGIRHCEREDSFADREAKETIHSSKFCLNSKMRISGLKISKEGVWDIVLNRNGSKLECRWEKKG